MKKLLFSLLTFFAFLLPAFCSTPAEAARIHITNNDRQTIYVAVAYFDDNDNDWAVCGWYSVNSYGGQRVLNFPAHRNQPYLWIHAHTYDHNTFTGLTQTFTCPRRGFSYQMSQGCPFNYDNKDYSFDRYDVDPYGDVYFVF